MTDSVLVQWLTVPLASPDGRGWVGQVSIGDKVYDLSVVRHDEPSGEKLEVRLCGWRRVRAGVVAPTEYHLWRHAGDGGWRCDCPAAGYNPHLPGRCKHTFAWDVLSRQLVDEFRSPETRTEVDNDSSNRDRPVPGDGPRAGGGSHQPVGRPGGDDAARLRRSDSPEPKGANDGSLEKNVP